MFLINSYAFVVTALPPVEQLLFDVNGDDTSAALLPDGVGDNMTSLLGDFEGDSSILVGTGSSIFNGAVINATYNTPYVPGNLIDGDTNTLWQASELVPQAISIDLGAGVTKVPVKLSIYGSATATDPKNFTFRASPDLITWTTIYTGLNVSWTLAGWKDFTFVNATAYRYFILAINDVQTNSFNPQIFEIAAYE